jgi:Zn-dependent protease with chaperone function
MKSKKYLRTLQHESKKFDVIIPSHKIKKNCSELFSDTNSNELLSYENNSFNNNLTDVEKIEYYLDYIEYYLNHYLKEPLISFMNSDFQNYANEIYVGILQTYDPNACAIKSPDNIPVIAFHYSLMKSLKYYNEHRLFSNRMLQIKNDFIAYISYCDNYWNKFVNFFKYGMTEMNFEKPKLTANDMILANHQTAAHELFIIAHEFAHIYLNHLNTFSKRFLHKKSDIYVIAYNHSQKQEFDADVQAVKWLVEMKNSLNESIKENFPLIINNVCNAIEVLMLFQLIEVKLDIQTKESSHPSIILRLQNIKNECYSLFEKEEKEYIDEMIKNAQVY